MAPQSVVYVNTEEEAKVVRDQVTQQRKAVAMKASVGYVLILIGVVWPFLPLMFGPGVPAISGALDLLMIWAGAAWVAYVKGSNIFWFLVGPFVVLLPTVPVMPEIKIGPKPGLVD